MIAAGREIADALAHAHANGVIHRDVKPDNIWIDAEGEAALGDFGVAVTEGENAEPAGTPRYAAPEQTLGEVVTPRSALFALGVTLYELLCGVRPSTRHPTAAAPPAAPSSLVPGVPPSSTGPARAARRQRRRPPRGRRMVADALDRLIARRRRSTATRPASSAAGRARRLRRALTEGLSGARAAPSSTTGRARDRQDDLCLTPSPPRRPAAAASRSGDAASRRPPVRVRRPIVRSLDARGRRADPALAPLLGGSGGAGGEEGRLALYDAVADLLGPRRPSDRCWWRSDTSTGRRLVAAAPRRSARRRRLLLASA